MSKPIIEVQNISKCYQLGSIGATRLRDDVERVWDRVTGKASKVDEREFWALRDVSFEVQPGEIVGIIGRNGAGKSTLLKILSRITEPTKGEIVMRGRVASLLEVGTGFHADLTGRENIFLNGAILGMTKVEIRSKLDEIIAFAEVEKFIDTPVKRYSSGMYVRLAFAVAAHLEPEILIVDEVLAVGDQQFQDKCIGKMKQVSATGRTVLFVSHNLASIRTLCTQGVMLKQGAVDIAGPISSVLTKYLGEIPDQTIINFAAHKERPSITRIEIESKSLAEGDIVVNIDFASPHAMRPPVPGLVIATNSGIPVFGSNPRFDGCDFKDVAMQSGRLQLALHRPPIRPGRYKMSVWLGDWQIDHDSKLDALSFEFGADQTLAHQPSLENIGPLTTESKWTATQIK